MHIISKEEIRYIHFTSNEKFSYEIWKNRIHKRLSFPVIFIINLVASYSICGQILNIFSWDEFNTWRSCSTSFPLSKGRKVVCTRYDHLIWSRCNDLSRGRWKTLTIPLIFPPNGVHIERISNRMNVFQFIFSRAKCANKGSRSWGFLFSLVGTSHQKDTVL